MRNVTQDRSCWAGQAMLFQCCGMSVSGVFVRSLPRGQRLQVVEIGDLGSPWSVRLSSSIYTTQASDPKSATLKPKELGLPT